MCVCGPKEAKKYLNSNEIIRVASKYPHIAKEYFNNQKLQTVEIVKLNGSVRTCADRWIIRGDRRYR